MSKIDGTEIRLHREGLICALLALMTLAVYWPVVHQEFTNYDDLDYVTNNPQVQRGITEPTVVWAFTTTHAHNWHPLTWLSHMLDCDLFGLDAGAHKLVNVAFHIASTLLLFLALNQTTSAPWRSAFVAAAFALHPLRVESVAWVAERKDVLSVFFWMLTMWAYVRYVKQPERRAYWLIAGFFALGLMAKPTLVTLPFALLLLDVWPLRRVPLEQPSEARRRILPLVREKVPLFALCAVSSVITFWAQGTAGGESAIKSLPLVLRAFNAMISYLRYINKTFWPVDLAVFYPHPGAWKFSEVLFAVVAIVCLTIVLVRVVRVSPWLTVGWLWYLGTFVPTIGFVQVGDQALADRYTYIPSIGLFIMIGWGLPEAVSAWRKGEVALKVAAIGVIAALVGTTRHQLQYWANSTALFEHALAVTKDNYIAHNNLGIVLVEKRKIKEATMHFREAVKIYSEFPEANKNLADVLAQAGQLDEAVRHYKQALQGKPDWPETHNNLGLTLARQGKLEEAIEHFSRAVQMDPKAEIAHSNMALALMKLGRLDEAHAHASRALNLDPLDAQAHYIIGVVLEGKGQLQEAARQYAEVLRLQPNHSDARSRLARIQAAKTNR